MLRNSKTDTYGMADTGSNPRGCDHDGDTRFKISEA